MGRFLAVYGCPGERFLGESILPREEEGGRRDLNPQRPEPQSGALPLSYDHHAGAEEESNPSSGSAKQIFSQSRGGELSIFSLQVAAGE